MAQTSFTPPSELTFSIGCGHLKLGDELSFPTNHRCPIKSRRRKVFSRSALQKSVTFRSSALRQGKFAEVRSSGAFPAAETAGKKALTAPVARDSKHINNKFSKMRKTCNNLEESLKSLLSNLQQAADFPNEQAATAPLS